MTESRPYRPTTRGVVVIRRKLGYEDYKTSQSTVTPVATMTIQYGQVLAVTADPTQNAKTYFTSHAS